MSFGHSRLERRFGDTTDPKHCGEASPPLGECTRGAEAEGELRGAEKPGAAMLTSWAMF